MKRLRGFQLPHTELFKGQVETFTRLSRPQQLYVHCALRRHCQACEKTKVLPETAQVLRELMETVRRWPPRRCLQELQEMAAAIPATQQRQRYSQYEAPLSDTPPARKAR